MNAVKIEEEISKLAEKSFDATEFPYAFLEAFGNNTTSINRLRKGESNKFDIAGGVLQTNNIHLAVCAASENDITKLTHAKTRAEIRTAEDIEKIVTTYQFRKEEDCYSKRVSMEEIAQKHDYNLNISRYITTSEPEQVIDLEDVHQTLDGLEKKIGTAFNKHNEFLKELGLPLLPKS